jgi:riboflavin kinase / FMN adenylyltransferase
MQVSHGVPAPGTRLTRTPSALTIGNFDGVHLGHRALLTRLGQSARERNLPLTVLTFEPHPREFFAPDKAPARLSSLREKLSRLADCGVDHVHVCRFNHDFSRLTASDFIERILVGGLGVQHVLIGDDFRFGQARQGDFALLQLAGQAHGFSVEAMQTVQNDGLRVSSSRVRELLQSGDLAQAAQLLGQPYAISGRVMHGRKLGRTLGFPTANIAMRRTTLPLSGVYAVRVDGLDTAAVQGAASIGYRPTLADGLAPLLEVHLLDFNRSIYGEHIRVNFLHKLRDEAKYDSLDALTAQITRDVADVRAWFATSPTES